MMTKIGKVIYVREGSIRKNKLIHTTTLLRSSTQQQPHNPCIVLSCSVRFYSIDMTWQENFCTWKNRLCKKAMEKNVLFVFNDGRFFFASSFAFQLKEKMWPRLNALRIEVCEYFEIIKNKTNEKHKVKIRICNFHYHIEVSMRLNSMKISQLKKLHFEANQKKREKKRQTSFGVWSCKNFSLVKQKRCHSMFESNKSEGNTERAREKENKS